MTFVAVRVTRTVPGIVGMLTDGRLRLIAVSGFSPRLAMLAAVSSKTIWASPALLRSTRPEPMSNGSAAVFRSSLTTFVVAVVMIADLMSPGVHVMCCALRRMAAPAMCGDDIDVPAMAWKYWPLGPEAMSAGVGVLPART